MVRGILSMEKLMNTQELNQVMLLFKSKNSLMKPSREREQTL
jgi:hypothetical protein